ncbi:hypothetical protein O181_084721 [Austropuccinia psidii MF-1]|uniref:Sensitive to high expression protein 9, mitochondrial n=1 Tax=Austropuccinia psidii MF-1 TaxID=1389203 RepID=A0A9Q3IJ21_9BASI|nr:hypothetical protein [Austropuccinia psidii MF-1]
MDGNPSKIPKQTWPSFISSIGTSHPRQWQPTKMKSYLQFNRFHLMHRSFVPWNHHLLIHPTTSSRSAIIGSSPNKFYSLSSSNSQSNHERSDPSSGSSFVDQNPTNDQPQHSLKLDESQKSNLQSKIDQQPIIDQLRDLHQPKYSNPTHPKLSSLLSSRFQLLRPQIQNQLHSTKDFLSNQLRLFPRRISQLTGYREIDRLKDLVTQKESDLKKSRMISQQMKHNFNQAAQRRAESVREVNDLLSRKANWSDQDLARFTTLVRTDHSNEQAESEAKKSLEEAESRVDIEFTAMMQAILSRYHEEQIWSDKIRSLSTTFSLSITLINVLVFLAAIVLVEPYKRAKVVAAVEERMIARDLGNAEILEQAFSDVVTKLAMTEKQLSELLSTLQSPPATSSIQEPLAEPSIIPTESPVFVNEEPTLSSGMSTSEATMNTATSQDFKENEEVADKMPSNEDQKPAEPPARESSSWNDWVKNLRIKLYEENNEQEMIKLMGICSILGIIILGCLTYSKNK